MRRSSENRIFARKQTADFIGRKSQFERLLKHAAGSGGLALLAAPSAGASELLRQVYEHLFFNQHDIIPFYFEFKPSDLTGRNTAARFLSEFLTQTVAFRRRDELIIHASPELGEIAELAVPSDGYWIDRLVTTYGYEEAVTDDRAFIRNCLSAPLRAAANDARAFVMIDALHVATHIESGIMLIEDLKDIFNRASIPFVFAGQRRFMFARTPFETIPLDALSFSEASQFVEQLAAATGVAINAQTRDLIAVQVAGNAEHMTSLFAAATANSGAFESFEQVEQTYTNEIFGGRIGKYFDAVIDGIVPYSGIQSRVIKLLLETAKAGSRKVPVSYWNRHMGLADADLKTVLDDLHYNEIVTAGSGYVEIDPSNVVLADYIRGRGRLEIDGDTRALAVGEAMADNLGRAPQLMARFYRRGSAMHLSDLLRAFDGRPVATALLDYGEFKEDLKGADDEKILSSLIEAGTKTPLPKIVFTANASAFYPKLDEICDAERSVAALGFADRTEVAWIAVEIDAKLEANRETAEFWCDRLEMVAISSNFANYKFWLVSPEGFDLEALQFLRGRGAYTSSRKQIDLLAGILDAHTRPETVFSGDEYEIVVPMGEDTEMIAAHTVEEIAKRHKFPSKAINQIKTALVEACINAAEHSLSPDRKIHQKFSVESDRITITISNRGLRLADKETVVTAPDAERRGWGLKLIKGLMDEVSVEQTDDGTRITMVKYLNPEATRKRSQVPVVAA